MVTGSGSGLPRLGSGIGYRESWDSWLRGGTSTAEWVEVVVERCEDLPADHRARLARLARTVPVVPHGVAPEFDVPGEVDAAAVAAGAALAAEWAAPWFSGHLYPSRATRASPRALGARARHLQDQLGVPFLLEIAEYDVPDTAELATAVLEHCDCGLVLNLALLWQAARGHGVDASAFLRGLPAERVVEVHLTTGDARGGAVEVHTDPVATRVWDLFAELAANTAVAASVVERDGEGGRDLVEVSADLDRARAVFSGSARPEPSGRP